MPGQLYTCAATVLADAGQALVAAGAKVPTLQVITAGQIAWEQCDMIGVTVMRSWLSDAFPTEATLTPQGQCGAAWFGADLVLDLVRCYPMPDAHGAGPFPPQLDVVAQQVMTDLEVLGFAVPCSLQDQLDANMIIDYVITQQMIIGPAGGQVATEVQFKVGLARNA